MGGVDRLGSTVSTRRKGWIVGHYRRNVSWDEGRGTREEDSEGLTTRLIVRFFFSDVPFELVGKVARAGAMAEASDVEGCATSSRHAAGLLKLAKKAVLRLKR